MVLPPPGEPGEADAGLPTSALLLLVLRTVLGNDCEVAAATPVTDGEASSCLVRPEANEEAFLPEVEAPPPLLPMIPPPRSAAEPDSPLDEPARETDPPAPAAAAAARREAVGPNASPPHGRESPLALLLTPIVLRPLPVVVEEKEEEFTARGGRSARVGVATADAEAVGGGAHALYGWLGCNCC